MAPLPYFGTYCRFTTKDKKSGGQLMGADNLVGDPYDIEFVREGADDVAWLKNRFGSLIGYLDADITHKLAVCKARSMTLHAILASVWFTERPEPGLYWGEVVLICHPESQADAFTPFIQSIKGLLADGIRPNVVLSSGSIQKIVESKGAWAPSERTPKLDNHTGTVLLKDHRTFGETLIEKTRQRNKGCMIGGWAAMFACIAILVLALKSCGTF